LVQLLPPRLRNHNVLVFLIALTRLHALVVGVLDDVLHILPVERVSDVPEKGAVRQSFVFTWLRHVLPEVFVLHEHGVELFYGELVIVRYTHKLDLAQME